VTGDECHVRRPALGALVDDGADRRSHPFVAIVTPVDVRTLRSEQVAIRSTIPVDDR